MLQIIGKYLIKILGKISEFEELNRTRSKKVKMFAFKVPLIIIWKGVKDKKKKFINFEWWMGDRSIACALWCQTVLMACFSVLVGVSKIILYS